METLALAHLTSAYEDPNPPQLRSLDLKIPSSAWIGVVGIVLSLLVFSTPPEPAQAYSCGAGCVTVSTNGSALNIRKNAGINHTIIGSLANGTRVATTGRVSNGWIELSNGGWIAGNWVASSSSSGGGGGGGGGSRAVKVSTNGSALRIRSGPGTGYAVIGSLSNGSRVSTTGQVSNGWIKLSNGGWIAGNWVASSGGGAGGGGGSGTRVATNGSPLLMRNSPGGAVIGSLANGSRISLTGNYNGSWAQLTNGAWVSSRWIR